MNTDYLISKVVIKIWEQTLKVIIMIITTIIIILIITVMIK